MQNNVVTKLYNVEVWIGSKHESTPHRNLPYAICQVKKKELLGKGNTSRQIHIVPVAK